MCDVRNGAGSGLAASGNEAGLADIRHSMRRAAFGPIPKLRSLLAFVGSGPKAAILLAHTAGCRL